MNKIEQLERQVEVLREAIGDVVHADSSLSAYNVALAAIAESDRIAAEPVEAGDWETVIGWLLDGSSRFIQLDNDRKVFHFFADDAVVSFDSVQAFNGEPTPHRCVAQMAAWVRAQKEAGNG